jgi:hypothetical protein
MFVAGLKAGSFLISGDNFGVLIYFLLNWVIFWGVRLIYNRR